MQDGVHVVKGLAPEAISGLLVVALGDAYPLLARILWQRFHELEAYGVHPKHLETVEAVIARLGLPDPFSKQERRLFSERRKGSRVSDAERSQAWKVWRARRAKTGDKE